MFLHTRGHEMLNSRVRPGTNKKLDKIVETHSENYYKKDIVSIAIDNLAKTLKQKGVKAGDDIEKKLNL